MRLLEQPAGLATLFLTEMWERLSYYGMRAILILFMVAPIAQGGLGLGDRAASTIYGLYIAGTYVFALLGGWIADCLIGAQTAVIGGGLLIAAGNTAIAIDSSHEVFIGLLTISIGVGLLKPNISALVARLYPEGGSRRDAGFSLFYVGINVGALLGSLMVPLGVNHFGWRFGFMLPAGCMIFGLFQFMLTRRRLGDIGRRPGYIENHPASSSPTPASRRLLLIGTVLSIPITLTLARDIAIDSKALARLASWAIACLAAGYFLYLLKFAGLGVAERRQVHVMAALFAGYALFMAGFEQAGASLNLFAERYTHRQLFGWQIPAGTFQAVTPLFVILFAPVFASLWLALGRHGRDLHPLSKFALGLGLLGGGFVVMEFASSSVLKEGQVSFTWLIVTYLIHEWGDLCLSPVGLSSMSRLVPTRLVGQALGIWFLAVALGNNFAGQLSSFYDLESVPSIQQLFRTLIILAWAGALILWALRQLLRRDLTVDDVTGGTQTV